MDDTVPAKVDFEGLSQQIKKTSVDERLRNVEHTLARIEVMLENFVRIENRLEEVRKDLKELTTRHESLVISVQQNALVVNAMKWIAATIIPLLLSVLITIAASWFRMGNGA